MNAKFEMGWRGRGGGWVRQGQAKCIVGNGKENKKIKEIDNDLEIENPQSGSSPTIPGRIEIWKY